MNNLETLTKLQISTFPWLLCTHSTIARPHLWWKSWQHTNQKYKALLSSLPTQAVNWGSRIQTQELCSEDTCPWTAKSQGARAMREQPTKTASPSLSWAFIQASGWSSYTTMPYCTLSDDRWKSQVGSREHLCQQGAVLRPQFQELFLRIHN